MFKRFTLHFVLIFLFAFAQIGAVTHEIKHVEDFATHGQQDKNTHSEQCEQCISFAKIAGGLIAQPFVFPVLQTNLVGSTRLQTLTSLQLLTAYAARAPPKLS